MPSIEVVVDISMVSGWAGGGGDDDDSDFKGVISKAFGCQRTATAAGDVYDDYYYTVRSEDERSPLSSRPSSRATDGQNERSPLSSRPSSRATDGRDRCMSCAATWKLAQSCANLASLRLSTFESRVGDLFAEAARSTRAEKVPLASFIRPWPRG
nr:hypothetical protein CFP56_56906 [Quercus suber]